VTRLPVAHLPVAAVSDTDELVQVLARPAASTLIMPCLLALVEGAQFVGSVSPDVTRNHVGILYRMCLHALIFDQARVRTEFVRRRLR
jgi:hypothetical protein